MTSMPKVFQKVIHNLDLIDKLVFDLLSQVVF